MQKGCHLFAARAWPGRARGATHDVAHAARRRSFNAGVTLMEVVVVLSVMAMLAALLLPAVQRARETARAAHCRNNLKQVALACDQFEIANRVYPPGQMFGPFGRGPNSTAWSFLARILPQVDQGTLYSQGGVPGKTLRDSGIAQAMIPLFLCPSDPSSWTGPRFDAGNMVEDDYPVGQTNYKGVSGANWGADESQNLPPGETGTLWQNIGTNGSYDGLDHGDGMFYRTDYLIKRARYQVTDGLSNTFMLGEDVPKYDIYCSWPYANNAYSTCAIPPNVKNQPDPRFWPNVQSFRSEHVGGLNFAFGDCSVRFINDQISLAVYRALSTIAGHEPVTADVAR